MTGESSSIIAIVLLMGYFYMRAGRRNYALNVFPLAIVPATYLLAHYTTPYIANLISIPANRIFLGIMLAGLIIGTVLAFHFSNNIKSTSSRKIFIFITPAFNLILTVIYLMYTLEI